MFRRVFTAPLVALALAASAAVATGAQAASLPSASTTAVTQVAAPAQASSASLDCGAGLVATICQVVLGPICRDRCLAATTAAPSTAGVTGAVRTSGRLQPGVASGSALSDIVCAPGFQILCTVLGLTICRNHPCGAAPSPALAATTSSTGIACEINLLCTVLGLTVCRHGCTFATGADAAVVINPRELCTVNLRPNPFCLLP